MFHQQHPPPPSSSSSSVPPYFPSQPHIVNPISSSFPPYSQPVLPPGVAAEPALHPPGTDPYSNSAALTATYVGYDGQPQYYADPSAVSHNWVVPQPDPAVYAFQSFIENQIASTSSNSVLNGNWANQSLTHNATRPKHVKTKFIQPVRCEVCKIDCNSKDVFDKHVMGKKHKKNVETQNGSLMGSTSSNSNINMPNQPGYYSGQVVQGTPGVPSTSKALKVKTKKRKLIDRGIKADSSRVCTVCNVVCNSQEVFDKHLSGKKHTAQAALTSQNPIGAAIGSQYDGSLKKKPKKTKVVQSAWCEVCKISCNSNEIYATHLSGKKHLKNVEKVEKGKNEANAPPLATGPIAIIGPVENPAANNPSGCDDVQKTQKNSAETPEELEAKKRGTAAVSVRTCTICNVVCNSPKVFDSHLAGQKHAAMMKKQAAASGMSMVVPPLVTALPM